MKLHSLLTFTAISALTLTLSSLPGNAGERRFTYSYEATTLPAGTLEFEQWITWKARRGDPGKSDQFDFRTEIEYGLTDRLQLGFYLSDWSLKHSGGKTDTDWKNVGIEAIWNLSNPTTHFLGSALYGEMKLGDELFVLEGKLLLQKNFGSVVVAYNATLEAKWLGEDYSEQVGEFKNTLGVSYQISPNFLIGAELLHEVEFEDWSESGDHALYVGPNFSFRTGDFFATTTVLFQTAGIDSEPDVQTRLILGFHF